MGKYATRAIAFPILEAWVQVELQAELNRIVWLVKRWHALSLEMVRK